MENNQELKHLHDTLFSEGLEVRRAVVGDQYVDKALENGSSEFARPGQELVTEWCWGHIWTRPGLERKQRSLLSKHIYQNRSRAFANYCDAYRYRHADCIKIVARARHSYAGRNQ